MYNSARKITGIEPLPASILVMTNPNQPDPDGRSDAELLKIRNRQINAVHTISRELSTTLDLDERLEHILTVSMDAVEALAGSILLHRAGDDKLVFRHVVGPNSEKLLDFAMNAGDGIAGAVFQSGEGRITNRPLDTGVHRSDISKTVTGFKTESIVTVPLKFQEGRPIGVMQILNKFTGEFHASDLEVLEILASIAATAIQNAQLYNDAQLAAVAHNVGELAHDIKNKVTPIKMAVDTLRPMMDDFYRDLDTAVDKLEDEYKEELTNSSNPLREFYGEMFDIMQDQVKEVQEFTKLIADSVHGQVTDPELTLNDLSPVIARQLDQLQAKAETQHLTIVRELSRIEPFKFDKVLIERAVYNLVNNAIPETPRGGSITIKSEVVPDEKVPTGRSAIIEVTDTGRGMPAHVLERILRGAAKSTKVGGTGLGTKIVYNAVAAHKGALEGSSIEGTGTTFRIKLPYRQ